MLTGWGCLASTYSPGDWCSRLAKGSFCGLKGIFGKALLQVSGIVRFSCSTALEVMPMPMPSVHERAAVLEANRMRKMARSAHAYVRGNTAKFYVWLDASPAAARVPSGPSIWICGDCHLGNLGPLTNGEGRIEIQIRDLDQAVIGNPAHDLIRLGLSLAHCGAWFRPAWRHHSAHGRGNDRWLRCRDARPHQRRSRGRARSGTQRQTRGVGAALEASCQGAAGSHRADNPPGQEVLGARWR